MINKCFISHASEDKEDFVRPLAHALRQRGINVWYDEFSLRAGDSLRRSIDEGLLESDFGVIVLSPHFFAKEWPQRELNALLTAEIAGLKQVLPVWHNVDAKFVASVSPMLADKVALQSTKGVEAIADELIELLPRTSSVSGHHLASMVESFMSRETYVLESLRTGCQHRFLKIQAFFVEYQRLMNSRVSHLNDEELEARIDQIVEELKPKEKQLLAVFDIPAEIELIPDEPLPERRLGAWMSGFEEWVSGTLEPEDADSLLEDMDIYLEVDHLYILFGLPNYSVSFEQREILDDAIREIGTWVQREAPEGLELICTRLRNTASASEVNARG